MPREFGGGVMTLTFGSLFAGIGGFDEGLRRAGMRDRWQVEIDPTCRNVLARHFPDSRRHDDVTTATSALGSVDLLCGGFPCQDLSVAGRRAGLAGGRSGLFYEFARLAAEIAPRWILLENVPGLLSSNQGRDMGAVLGTLGELGYGWAYRILDAQHFGLAQRRERVFIIGCLGDAASAAQVLFEPTSCGGDSPPRRETGEGAAGTLGGGTPGGGPRTDTDRMTFLPVAFGGNNTSGPIPVAAGLNAKGGSGRMDFETETFITQSPIAFHSTQDPISSTERWPALGTGNSEGCGALAVAFTQNTRDEVRYINGDGAISGALSAQEGTHQRTYVAQPAYGIGSHAGSDGDASNSSHSKGGPVGFGIVEEGVPALRAGRTQAISAAMAVRRLTPTECERLMGLPDGWTAFGADGKPISDSARYRMLGNSIVVPVAHWIGRRIVGVA